VAAGAAFFVTELFPAAVLTFIVLEELRELFAGVREEEAADADADRFFFGPDAGTGLSPVSADGTESLALFLRQESE
jgi:hypothetical protein